MDIEPKSNVLNQAIFNKARSDKFAFAMSFPEVMKNMDTKYPATNLNRQVLTDRLIFSVYAVNIPGIQIPKIPVPFAGQVPNVTSHSRPIYTEPRVKFNVDNEYINYGCIWHWLNLFNDSTKGNSSSKVNMQFLPNYSAKFTIFALDEFNKYVASWDMEGCYPTSLDEIQFDNQNPGEIVSGFTFSFQTLDMTFIN